MPEEVTPDTGNTTENAATQIDWESADNPYVQRYREAQSHLTPVQQENARLKALESDPQAFLELGKKQGWIEYDEQQQGGGDDPYAERWARLDAAEQRIAEHDARIAAENVAAGQDLFHTDLDTWAEKDGVKLSKADHNAIFGLLLQAPDPTQESTAREVYEAHVADMKAQREALAEEIREEMRRPRVPTPPTGGAPNTGAPNWGEMTPAQIDEYMAARMAGNA